MNAIQQVEIIEALQSLLTESEASARRYQSGDEKKVSLNPLRSRGRVHRLNLSGIHDMSARAGARIGKSTASGQLAMRSRLSPQEDTTLGPRPAEESRTDRRSGRAPMLAVIAFPSRKSAP
jgi:hypothetical protein